jgi:CrcB protein
MSPPWQSGLALARSLYELKERRRNAGDQNPRMHAARPARLQLAVFAGGVVGALARGGLEEALPWHGHGWPWATFAANVGGTFVLGLLVTRLQERLPPSTYRRPLVATGFCGALTTFSSLQVELLRLARHGEAGVAAAYLAASVGAGLLGVYLATAAVRRVRPA